MPQLLTDPSQAFVLGTLTDLYREYRALSATLEGGAHGDVDSRSDALTLALGDFWRERKALYALRADSHSAARQLGEKNQLRAELLPKLAKLRARAEVLKQGQEQSRSPENARALRRSRAVVGVQIEDMEKDTARAEGEAQVLREQVHRLDGLMRTGRANEQAAQKRVTLLQKSNPGLLPQTRLCALRLALAHGQLRTCGERPSDAQIGRWQQQVLEVTQSWVALCGGMAQGRFADEDAQGLMGGRGYLTGETVAALVALGDVSGASQAFARMCGDHGFLHQIFYVYRAYALGLYVGEQQAALIEVLRMHRYAQGLRGALAECLWQLTRADEQGFARLLPQVVALEAQMWSASDLPGLGLISLMGCALVRLGRLQGFAPPAHLGPTVPYGPWSVATPTRVR